MTPKSKRMGNKLFLILPGRFRWTVHNVVAHPLSEIFYQVGLENLGNKVHDWTIPWHEVGNGRG